MEGGDGGGSVKLKQVDKSCGPAMNFNDGWGGGGGGPRCK